MVNIVFDGAPLIIPIVVLSVGAALYLAARAILLILTVIEANREEKEKEEKKISRRIKK